MKIFFDRWIRPAVRLAWRVAVTVAMLGYVATGIVSLKLLNTQRLYAAQDFEAVNALIAEGVEKRNMLAVRDWVHARPLAETDRLIEKLSPKSAVFESGLFFEFFRRKLKQGQPEEALFWLQLGRFRMHYDMLRCDAPKEKTDRMRKMLDFAPAPEIKALLRDNPAAMKTALQRVLDFDAKYPADNDPDLVCDALGAEITDSMTWNGYYYALRQMTEDHLKKTAP